MAEAARIDDGGARELAVILRAAARRARQVALNPPGGTERARELARAQAAARLSDLQRDLNRMNAQANGIINDRVRRSYSRGVRDAERMMREVGLVRPDEPIQGALMGTETQRAGVLVRRAQGDINKAFNSIANVTGRAVRNARALGLDSGKIKRLLAGGSIDGQPTLVVQRVREQMRKIAINGMVEVPTRSGTVITYKPDYYADLVYQTMMAEAAVVGEIDRLAAKGHDLVKIIGSNSVHFCTAFVGKVFSLSGASSTYPAYSRLPRGGPPFHPHCTKRIIPFNERLASPTEKKKALPDDESSKLLDTDPTNAQKRFEETKPTPPPAPKPPPEPAPQPVPERAPAGVKQQAQDARRQLREIGEGFAETERRLAVERNAISSTMQRALEDGNHPLFYEIEQQHARVAAEQRSLVEAKAKAGRAVVAASQPATTTLTTTLSGKRRQVVQEGVRELAKMVDAKLLPNIRIQAAAPAKGHRRSYYLNGTIHMTQDAPVPVVIHEIGHLIEDASPGLHKAAIAFLERRTQGEALQTLRALTGNRGYRADERARPDDFFNAYVGKDYRGLYSEIVSMGLEYLWRDPVGFAARDPDFFDFLFRAMRGDFT